MDMTLSMDVPKAPTAYQFVMDKWLPTTIPVKRLAQYLDKLSLLFGNTDSVHFVKITAGSARPLFEVEEVAALDVAHRLMAANDDKSSDGARLCKDINRMLMEDGCIGYLRVHHGQRVIEFQGRKTPISQEVTVHEPGELEGQVIRVGGKDATVPVHLMGIEGEYYKCQASRTIAKQLAHLLFGDQVRASGKGKWRRNAEGMWNLEEFHIAEFVQLDDVPLAGFVKDMRAIPGSAWNEMEDPQAELKRLRED